MKNSPPIHVITPHLPMAYDDVLKWQKSVHQNAYSQFTQYFWLGEHQSVITCGKNSKAEHVLVDENELKKNGILLRSIDRGGDVTWHGPGQLVGYPIIDLTHFKQDLHWYLRQLEQVIINTLADFNLSAFIVEGKTGVWVNHESNEKKIASIGVHVSRWITKHGFSFNVTPDLSSFKYINACGLHCQQTSVKELLSGQLPLMDEIKKKVLYHFSDIFGCQLVYKDHALCH